MMRKTLNEQIKFLKECLERIEKRKDRKIDLIECILTAEKASKSKALSRSLSRTASNKNDVQSNESKKDHFRLITPDFLTEDVNDDRSITGIIPNHNKKESIDDLFCLYWLK
ncbi:12878_t:CDS:2, partial [Funneliformis geosporum]